MDAQAAISQATDSSGVNTLLQQEKLDLGPMEAQVQKTMDEPVPQPKLQEAPKEPDMNFGKDATAWIGTLNVLAGLGGARARQGATTALTAFSSGVEGFKQGKLDAFKQQQEQWKDANQEVIENNKAQVEAYKAALQDKKLSVDQQMAEIKMTALQYHNEIVSQFAEQRNFTAVARVLDMMQKNTDDLEAQVGTLSGGLDKINTVTDAATQAVQYYNQNFVDPATGKPIPGAPPMDQYVKIKVQDAVKASGGAAGGVAGNSPEAVHAMAEGLYNGMSPAQMGLSTRTTKNPTLAAVRNDLMQNHPDFDFASAMLKMKGETAGASAGARREVLTSQAVGELDALIPQARADLSQLKNSRFPDYNSLINSAEYRAGDPDIVGAANTVQEVANAYTAVMVRGGQRSDAAQAAADALLKTNFSDPQWNRALDTMQRNSKAVMGGIHKGTQNFLSGNSKDDSGATGGGSGQSDPLGIR